MPAVAVRRKKQAYERIPVGKTDNLLTGEYAGFGFIVPTYNNPREKNLFSACRESALSRICKQGNDLVPQEFKVRLFLQVSASESTTKARFKRLVNNIWEFEERFCPWKPARMYETSQENIFYFEFSASYRRYPQLISMLLTIIKAPFSEATEKQRVTYTKYFFDKVKNISETFSDESYEKYCTNGPGSFSGVRAGIVTWMSNHGVPSS